MSGFIFICVVYAVSVFLENIFLSILGSIEIYHWNKGICRKTNKKWEIKAIIDRGIFEFDKRQYTDNCNNYLTLRLIDCGDMFELVDMYNEEELCKLKRTK